MTRRPKPTMHGRDHAPDGPDPIPAAGGVFIPKAQVWNPNGTAVAAGATTSLDWGGTSGPDTLVSAVNSYTMMILEDGTYAFEITVRGISLAAGSGYLVQVSTIGTQYASAVAVAGVTSTYTGRTVVHPMAYTTTIQVAVMNNDSASRNFYMEDCRLTQIAPYPDW